MPDKQTPAVHLQEIDRSRIRIGGSAIRHGPVGTIPESSVSVVVSLDICGHDAHNRTRPCLTNLWVGNSNPIIVNNGMAITNRETPHRPGPHPHQSVFTSFVPHAIIMHHIRITPLITGYFISRIHVQKHAHRLQIGIM